tara:strand:+ start:38054 stop:38470 length:417 start_codon:yes stop_codon:yes gene_type:complete
MNKLCDSKIFFILLFSLSYLYSEDLSISNHEMYPFENTEKELIFLSLIENLRCPKCQSSNLAGSNAPIAQDLKLEVYRLVKVGNSESEVKKYLVDRYGDYIVYNPPINNLTFAIWLGPFLLVILTLLVIFYLRSRRLN